jgi:hypothetical protein
MSQQAATIMSFPMAFEMVKAMQAEGPEWGEGYRPLGRQALAEVIEDQMAMAVDPYLDQIGVDDAPDRRNDIDELLTCFRYKSADQRKAVRTTNAIERRFREVRRRTRPMGTFQHCACQWHQGCGGLNTGGDAPPD